MNAANVNKPTVAFSSEDAALAHKFRGIGGGALFVDATFETKGMVFIFRDTGTLFNGGAGQYSPNHNLGASYFEDAKHEGKLPVPKTLRMLRYPLDASPNAKWHYDRSDLSTRPFFGNPLVDVTVPIASRIPEEVVDHIRQYNGSLTLKLRLTPETMLVGWEVNLGKNYPFKTDRLGAAYLTDEDTLAGGDFSERRVFRRLINDSYELVEKKGWYIDPKTRQRIETDF